MGQGKSQVAGTTKIITKNLGKTAQEAK